MLGDFIDDHTGLYLLGLLVAGILSFAATWFVCRVLTRCARWLYRITTGNDQPPYFDIQEPTLWDHRYDDQVDRE